MPHTLKAMTYKNKSQQKVNYQQVSHKQKRQPGGNSFCVTHSYRRWMLFAKHFFLIVSLLNAPLPSFAQANGQIVEDTTFLENSVIQRSADNTEIKIEGGARRDGNLFHRFEQFNVNEGQAVYFSPEVGVENIFSRVTVIDKNNSSTISGTLGVEGPASLWLINPNGIVFGENASLDISGSFYATTAPAISIGDGSFSAATEENSLLSIAPEVSFQNFLNSISEQREEGRDITVLGNNLGVNGTLVFAARNIIAGGDSLNLMAGNSLLLAARNAIQANGVDLSLIASEGSMEVSRIRANRNNKVDIAGNVSLTAGGDITTHGINSSSSSNFEDASAGGNIEITTTSGGSIENRGTLNARSISGTSNAAGNRIGTGNAAAGGNITLITESGGNIINRDLVESQSNAAEGNANSSGAIVMHTQADGNIVNEGVLRAQSISASGDSGMGGNISLTTTNGSIHNLRPLSSQSSAGASQSLVENRTLGESRRVGGGAITITAEGDIRNEGSLNSFSLSRSGIAGDGGVIYLTALSSGNITNLDPIRSLSLSDGGNAGTGGNISMAATGTGSITNNGEINAQSLANGIDDQSGNAMSAGNIIVQTELGDIINGPLNVATLDDNSGSFNTRSVSREGTTANGGLISITSSGGDIFLNSYINSKSYSIEGLASQGGNIIVSTELGSIVGGRLNNTIRTGIITSSVSGEINDATNDLRTGSVVLQAGDSISGLNIFTLSDIGSSGNIIIQGTGDLEAEDIQVITNEEFVLDNLNDDNRLFPSNIFDSIEEFPVIINSPQSGSPGNVWITSTGNLTASNLIISNDANSPKDAGNITLSSNTLISPIEALMTPEDLVTIEEIENSRETTTSEQFITSRGLLNSENSESYTLSLTPNTLNASQDGIIRLFDSRLATNTTSGGSGGDISIRRASAVVLDNTDLETNTAGSATAGSIFISSDDYVLLRGGSLLLADAQGLEDGGEITINAPRVIASPDGNNDIIVNARAGDAGSIFSPDAVLYGFEEQSGFTTSELRSLRSNDISASSQTGQNGIITFDALVNAPIREESEELSEDFSSPEQLISNSCIAGDIAENGRFTIPGTGNFPTSPNNSTASSYDLDDVETLPTARSTARSSEAPDVTSTAAEASQQAAKEWQLGDPVIEPEAVEQLADGRVVFGQRCNVQ